MRPSSRMFVLSVALVSILLTALPAASLLQSRGDGAIAPSRSKPTAGSARATGPEKRSPSKTGTTIPAKRAQAPGRRASEATPIPWVDTAKIDVGFGIYNQGSGDSSLAEVRAFVSDHGSDGAHEFTCSRNNEVQLQLVTDLPCSGANCLPALTPGQIASYEGSFDAPLGGFGRHEITSELAPNAAVENANGSFSVYAGEGDASSVSFRFGRYLWIDADSALDEDGEKVGEAGQTLDVLMANDRAAQLIEQDAPTFGELTMLSANFFAYGTEDSEADAPRLDVYFAGHGKLGIRLGYPCCYNDSPFGLNSFSGANVIGSPHFGRYDTSGLQDLEGDPPLNAESDYATALALVEDFVIDRIDFVADDVDGDPREYRLGQINVGTGEVTAPATTVIQNGMRFPLGIVANSTKVFWTERGEVNWDDAVPSTPVNLGNIWTSNINGSSPQILVPNVVRPEWIAATETTVYWSSRGTHNGEPPENRTYTGQIMKYEEGDVTTVAPAEGFISAMILIGDKPYWSSNSMIRSIDDEGLPIDIHDTQTGVINLASDGNYIFWTTYGGDDDGKVGQVPIEGEVEGGETAIFLATGEYRTWDVHTDGTYVYWSNSGNGIQPGLIKRVPIGGGPVTQLLSVMNISHYFGLDANYVYYYGAAGLYGLPHGGGADVLIAPNTDDCGGGLAHPFSGDHSIYMTQNCGDVFLPTGRAVRVHW